MKFLVLFVALLACTLAFVEEEKDEVLMDEQQLENLMQNETLTAASKGLILNSEAKKFAKNILKQMPCGWPDYNIPPLAPYTKENLKLQLKKYVVDSLLDFFRFRFDGLDKMQIKKLKVSYTFNKKVKFHFIFKELKVSAHLLETDTFLDLSKLGLDVRYKGSGPLEFYLNNLSIKGDFKYKAPLIFGYVMIYNFHSTVTLGSVTSKIGGILGNGQLNALVNQQIEYLIPTFINEHQDEISAVIEENLVPQINTAMKGKKVWALLRMLAHWKHKRYPTPAPCLMEN